MKRRYEMNTQVANVLMELVYERGLEMHMTVGVPFTDGNGGRMACVTLEPADGLDGLPGGLLDEVIETCRRRFWGDC